MTSLLGGSGAPVPSREQITSYYDRSLIDTAAVWSENVHFGYYELGTGGFDKQRMLQRMNERTLDSLRLPSDRDVRIIDLGCGLGASSFHAAARYPRAKIWAVNVARGQLARAMETGVGLGLTPGRVQFLRADYRCTPLADAEVDAAFAIESACYAGGASKADLLREAFRILKPGGRFAVADGFVRSRDVRDPVFRALYRKTCEYWELGEMACVRDFVNAAIGEGFVNVRVDDISWNVLPSFLFVPSACVRGFARILFSSDAPEVRSARVRNVLAPYLQSWLCLYPHYIGYFIITVQKPGFLDDELLANGHLANKARRSTPPSLSA